MKIININKIQAVIELSPDEFYMLYYASSGPTFYKQGKADDSAWSGLAETQFIDRFRSIYKLNKGKEINVSLSKGEILFLIKFQNETMKELGKQEYPAIVGHDFSEAQNLLDELKTIYNVFN